MSDRNIAIIGTGNFARGLAVSFIKAGYNVYCGSSDPERRNLVETDATLASVSVVSQRECVTKSDIVFVCLHQEAHSQVIPPLAEMLIGKLVVDVSNPKKISKGESIAEGLQRLLPGSDVVKAFSTLSAYTLQSDSWMSGESKNVYVCGNRPESRAAVSQIARECGFTPVECGSLSTAGEVENMPLHFMKGWGYGSAVTLGLFIWCFIYGAVSTHVFGRLPWDHFTLYTLNKIFSSTALTLLTTCYFGGAVAAITQMARGTKYRPFAKCLDRWLRARKTMGLFALLFGGMHSCMSLLQMNPGYYPTYYLSSTITIPANLKEDLELPASPQLGIQIEIALLCGILSLAILVILGITSIPAVTALMNWKEWNFIQAKLGWWAVLIATTHLGLMNDWFDPNMANNKATTSLFPTVVLIVKLVIIFPCLDNYLWKIRRGHQRKAAAEADANMLI